MEFRIAKFGYKIHFSFEFRPAEPWLNVHFSFERVEIVSGVNSKIDENTHFLMWDFDEIPLSLVITALRGVQAEFDLPTITILASGRTDCYHAYCFKACSFLETRVILTSTPNLDLKHFAIGLMRGYFTLRYTDAGGYNFRQVGALFSDTPADLSYKDVNNWVQYTKPIRKEASHGKKG